MYFKIYKDLSEFYEKNYQLPTWLMKVEPFKGMSSNAKLLYVILRQRMAYSINNGYIEPDGTPYVIFTRKDMCEQLNASNKTATVVVQELTNIGLIAEKHIGLNKANHIYVHYPVLEGEGNCSANIGSDDITDTSNNTGNFHSNEKRYPPENAND